MLDLKGTNGTIFGLVTGFVLYIPLDIVFTILLNEAGKAGGLL
jgi:hypothetical protein